ncbi:MAG: hypothetical protein Q8R92_17405, partial [Deltaproteobacteria bacterium]|nr:hypothetical protein [Deltaproteobacteria bacterium]
MYGSPSSSGPPSSSGSSGPGAPSPPRDPPGGLDLRRFTAAFVLAYLLGWALWIAASPAYERLLAGAASAALHRLTPRVTHHQVTLVDRTFYVHLWAKIPATGTKIDARSTHFNWLILLPLLVATRALGRGVPGAAGALAAVLALAGFQLLFLIGVGEY